MTARFVTFGADDSREPWTHWNQDYMGDWRANFYNTSEPYMRHPRMLTASGPNARQRMEEMKEQVDAKAAADGLVTFDKLPEDIREFWAESDANMIAASVLRHLAGRG